MTECNIQEKEGKMKVTSTSIFCIFCNLVSANVKSTFLGFLVLSSSWLFYSNLADFLLSLSAASLFLSPPSSPPPPALSHTK